MAIGKNEAAKIYVKEYDIEIGGKTRKVRYDMTAFAALEDAGYEYKDIIEMATKVSFKGLPPLVWAGLQGAEDTELSLEDLRRMIDIQKFLDLQDKLPAALMNSLPIKEDKDDEQPKNPGAQETKIPK